MADDQKPFTLCVLVVRISDIGGPSTVTKDTKVHYLTFLSWTRPDIRNKLQQSLSFRFFVN